MRPTIAAIALALAGCATFQAPKSEPLSLYRLDPALGGGNPGEGSGNLTVVVDPVRARPGFDTPRMAYVKQPYAIEYFTRNQWVEPPARMVGPLLAQALQRTGRFRAVVLGPSGIPAGLRVSAEVVRLQQEFAGQPSQVRFALHLWLVDLDGRRVLGEKELEATATAPSDDPYGGVVAANEAVQKVLEEAAAYVAAEAARLAVPAGESTSR